MSDGWLLSGAIMLAIPAWLFCAWGWWKVVKAPGDSARMDALNMAAFVTVLASVVTAGAAFAALW